MLIDILIYTVAYVGGAAISAIATFLVAVRLLRTEGYNGITACLALALLGVGIWTAGFALWLI